jgi:hypothetical protein
MRNAMPMCWIEQAEARQVLATALFEQAPMPSWFSIAQEASLQGLARIALLARSRVPDGVARSRRRVR